MAILKCKMCGGNLEITDGMTVCECEYCGSRQTVPSVDNEKKITLFTRANRLRAAGEFDKAFGVYESIIAEFPEEAEAYWGLLLCKYGIEYVDDPKTGKKIPTCHRSSFDSVFEDNDFEMVMEYSDVYSRAVYREEAKAVEELRVRIIEVSSKEEPYDIFICYKETAEDGQRTIDSVLAQDVYDELTSRGYKVFFSRITLEDKLGQEYEPYIFAALNSAKIMLAFGTDYEYYNAVWVKNEWSRFLSLIARGEKKTLIPCYKDIDAYDMPAEFKRLQAQDMGKVGAVQDLIRGIEKIIGKKGQSASVIAGSEDTGALTKRGYLYLEDMDYAKAVEYFEKALDENPEDGGAYLGEVLAKARIQSVDELEKLPISLESIPYYLKAVRFSSGPQQVRLQGILDENKKRGGNNHELAENVVNGDIKKLISLAPSLITIVEHLKSSEYEKVLGFTKNEIDAALLKYEVFRVLETSGVPMNTDDLKAASSKIASADDKLIRSALVEINNAGYIALDEKKFSFISESFRAEKAREYGSKYEEEIESLQKQIDAIDAKVPVLNEQISQFHNKMDFITQDAPAGEEEIAGRRRAAIAKRQEQISSVQAEILKLDSQKQVKQREYDSIQEDLDRLENQKSAAKKELKSLSFFQGKRKKEIQTHIDAIIGQMSPVETELNNKGREISELDSRILLKRGEITSIETTIKALENGEALNSDGSEVRELETLEAELKELPSMKAELESRITGIKSELEAYEWKPEAIDENFNDGCQNIDVEYEYIMANFYKSNEKVKAIKYYRQQTGLGLKNATDVINSMWDGTYVPRAAGRRM